MAYKVLACLALLAVSSAKRDQSRWSRQISSYTSDMSDWVPLTAPIDTDPPLQLKRQVAEPRILSEPISGLARPADFNADMFSSRGFYNTPGGNRQLYLQSVPSAPQNYLTDQGFNQGFRFGLSQPNFPLTQGFVGPQFNFDNVPQLRPKPQVSNPIRFDNFPQQIQSIPSSIKPNFNQPLKLKSEVPKYVDGYRMENNSDVRHIATPQRKPQSLQKIRFDEYDKSREIFNVPKPKTEREEVQLLYVPVESLNRGQFNFRSPLTSAQLLNTELYNQNQKQNPNRQNFGHDYQRPITKPFSSDTLHHDFMTNFSPQINGQGAPNFSTVSSPFPTLVSTTTVKPKKLKPHQPPLAIFLTQNAKKENEIKVGDVLSSLKSAKSVAVLDTVNTLNAPEVFIGPSSLSPPERYVKFELPYLSNIENKDKKLKQLPFFVAPLSYNTPQGFAKIPFPSPHVGSVVINSQIQEASSTKPAIADDYLNSYIEPSIYKEQQPVTQKPKMHYYSTVAPKENYVNNYEQSYYSFEPQTVSTLRPYTEQVNPVTAPPKTGSYFLSNIENQFNPSQYSNFQPVPNYQNLGTSVKTLNTVKAETTSAPKTTTTTTKLPSTYPSQLLETHNPFSINQAFHFSTPNDYQNVYDEFKEPYVTQGLNSPSSTTTPVSSPAQQTINFDETKLHKPSESNQLSTSNYQQSYSPEIQYQKELQSYPSFNIHDYSTKNVRPQQNDYIQPSEAVKANDNIKTAEEQSQSVNNAYSETQTPVFQNYTNNISGAPESESYNLQSTNPLDEYNQYDTNYSSEETHPTSTTSTSSTTTTRRTPTRARGRPRYPTTKPTESSEYSTRSTITRKPARERRPLPNRPRYEPNKVTTERTTRKPSESSESTTKSFKPRIRGKLHYKPTDGDEPYEKPSKKGGKDDLAYQRDILHQNYPVTLMERASTIDIEAITEPTVKADSSVVDNTKADDTENADSNDKLLITEHVNSQIKDVSQYTSAVEVDTDIYVPKVHSNEEEYYQSRTIAPTQDSKSSYEIKEDTTYSSHATPEVRLYENEFLDSKTDNRDSEQGSLEKTEYSTEKVTLPETDNTKHITINEMGNDQEQEVNIVETTPSYNRVRIRPGVIRQHRPISSTESTRNKNDRRQNSPITYRPAFDKRRTTMRIEEIEADLKTKQVHSRPEFKDYRQPVYKPDPVTESASSSTEATTKRSQLRRKRPTYTTSSTEGTINRRPYELKNRFRGRRPTEKPTDKPDTQTDVTTSSPVRNVSYSKYSHRPRLSERYNKKPESEDSVSEDQDSNYSLHRPKYATLESERWSPKISVESFKPYNPNDIVEENNAEKSDKKTQDEELDIITAKNEEDVLIAVTPATNHRLNKNIEDIPPTLEALVEKTQVNKGEAGEPAATFESMLEEVMKSLEEQDEDEYTSKVMKHKGGEIGEIPPERIISSGVNYSLKSTRSQQEQTTTATLQTEETASPEIIEKEDSRKSRRRGYWKKVKVRPAEGIDVAESQYYTDTVNKLGDHIHKNTPEKAIGKTEVKVTTYKPKYQFIKDFFESEEDAIDGIPHIDVPKINITSTETYRDDLKVTGHFTTEASLSKETPLDDANPGDMDLGTGSPDPTYDDNSYYSDPTEPTSTSTKVDRSDKFNIMDYLFGVTSPDDSDTNVNKNDTIHKVVETTTKSHYKTIDRGSHQVKTKATTESAYIPEEITADSQSENTEYVTEDVRDSVEERTEVAKVENVESSSVSSYMDPTNVVSTSMSTEISHETEICFRGKCIKTNKDLL